MFTDVAPRVILLRYTPLAKIGFDQLQQRLPVIGLVGQDNIDGFRRHIEQLGIGNFVAVFPEHLDQRFRLAGYRDDIPLLQDGCRCELDQLAVTAQTLDEDAGVPVVGSAPATVVPAASDLRSCRRDVETAIR
jgi:hypothetical protein